ncbi:gephyrin-like molybdotransferase Glp [Cellulomonas sp. HZM]|uniref:molybdopterin-binding protein n=1 Tax=Cellulomonas sp. HZM TaxID=1454010 RepID=UPI000A771ECC|nr:gephyrin-like molybdotransferase Glp [Cellulomonas sp. HZM]
MSGCGSAAGRISLAEHRAAVLASLAPLDAVRVPTVTATGRLAADVHAVLAVPPWTNAAMDGFAVRYADVAHARPDAAVRLRVVADVPAGSSLDPALGPGEAARIMTGAPLPSDADTVVPLEHTDRDDPSAPLATSVAVRTEPPGPGRHVRYAGEDRRVGDLVARAGTVVGTQVRAALVSAGHGTVEVRRAPRVLVVSTGSELRDPGAPLARGQVPDCDGPMLADLVREAGGEVVGLERATDEPDALARLVAAWDGTADVVVLSGGVGAGAFDPVRRAFAATGDVRFVHVAMQPGKPQAAGRLPGGTLLLGLPGNPVAAWVSFQVFVRPALHALQGSPRPVPAAVPARALAGWRAAEGRDQVVPARIAVAPDGTLTVEPAAAPRSMSHRIGSLADANGYALVAAGHAGGQVLPGDVVDVVLTGPPAAARAPRTAAVVLSGGRGSRLGGVRKGDVHVGARSMLDVVLDGLDAAGIADVVVVGHPGETPRPDVQVVREEPPFGGPLAGIGSGLAALPDSVERVLLLACDLPRAPEIVALLLRAPAAVDAGCDGVVLRDRDGRLQWLAGLYDAPALRAQVRTLDEVGGLAGRPVRAALERLRLVEVDDPDGLTLDVDTTADLDEARRLLGGGR